MVLPTPTTVNECLALTPSNASVSIGTSLKLTPLWTRFPKLFDPRIWGGGVCLRMAKTKNIEHHPQTLRRKGGLYPECWRGESGGI